MTTATARRTKKTLTPDQLAAQAERKASMTRLCKTIGAMSETDRLALASQVAHVMTCEGRSLSVFNQCMLAMQRPDTTIVGGFQQWLKHGRCVRKGEHGMAIWIPLGDRDAETGRVMMEPEQRRFLLATVFDVSQTDEKA